MLERETYIDSRGWLYEVGTTSLSGNEWKIFYSKNNGKGWHSVQACHWFDTIDAAAQYLKAYATKKDLKLTKTVYENNAKKWCERVVY